MALGGQGVLKEAMWLLQHVQFLVKEHHQHAVVSHWASTLNILFLSGVMGVKYI